MSQIFGNSTNGAHWEPSPLRRGTFDIVTSCLFTIALCVWTAVHMNIPACDEVWAQIKRKIGWLVLALLAPDCVVFTAWHQWRQAFHIANRVNEAHGDPPLQLWWQMLYGWCVRKTGKYWSFLEPSDSSETETGTSLIRCNENERPSLEASRVTYKTRHEAVMQQYVRRNKLPQLTASRRPVDTAAKSQYRHSDQRHGARSTSVVSESRHVWTMKHGFFAVMGGFGFDILDEDRRRLRLPDNTGKVLTTGGIQTLLEHSEKSILNISKGEIEDKSKSNALGKVIVCLQVSWFFAQCLSRWLLSMPISLLELSTSAHGVCAILMMLFWWDKPFEVEQSRKMSLSDLGPGSFFRRLFTLTKYNHIHINYAVKTISFSRPFTPFSKATTSAHEDLGTIYLMQGYEYLDTGFNFFGRSATDGLAMIGDRISVSGADRALVTRALQAYDSVNLDPEWVFKINSSMVSPRIGQRPHISFAQRLDIGPYEQFLQRFDLVITTIAALSLSGILYGGLHLLAWRAPFHTRSEQILWQISTCTIVGIGLVFGFLSVTAMSSRSPLSAKCKTLLRKMYLIWRRMFRMGIKSNHSMLVPAGAGIWKRYAYWVFIVLAYLIAMSYAAARIYIVVACFVSLAYPPMGTFNVPNWSAYFPHF